MCGIFGIMTSAESSIRGDRLRQTINHLFTLSESRGKEAAGLAFLHGDEIEIMKQPLAASAMLKTHSYQNIWNSNLKNNKPEMASPTVIMGHTRLVTNGKQTVYENNQPVIKDDIVCIHNGIIVNEQEIWQRHRRINKSYEVDTEVLPALIRMYLTDKFSMEDAVRHTFQQIKGVASIAFVTDDRDVLILASNNGSLYFCLDRRRSSLIFASESYILNQLLRKLFLKRMSGDFEISQVKPMTAYLVDFNKKIEPQKFTLDISNGNSIFVDSPKSKRLIKEILSEETRLNVKRFQPQNFNLKLDNEKLLTVNQSAIRSLRRCSRCILPETFPFIRFDHLGICNYCHDYQRTPLKGVQTLFDLVKPYRSESFKPDCIVPFSGGRDSSFGLHYIKTVLKLNPVAYTYDWGMVTDIARRNISRICGQLGVEHILLSADIDRKRRNIRKNVLAWLQKPSLGTVPLFMAGDKQFFFYARQLKRQLGIDLLIFSMNNLERTDFKAGFCSIDEHRPKDEHYNLSFLNKIKIALFYGKEFLLNPAYVNASIFDSLFAYFSYYLIPKEYFTIYEYISWNEQLINDTLIKEYDWEMDTSTRSTWRIGDGTASFYNYIYYKVAGFSEYDTFASNQIREGMISREEGLQKSETENQPKFQAINWYCDTIGIDFESTIKRINQMPTLY